MACDGIAQMSLQRGINFRSLAEKMGNCSGAEVRGICTEAGKSKLQRILSLQRV
jgi:26S proteasome regulatory subunit T6